MDPQPPKNDSPRQRKTLVSVERQYETDVATGQTATRMFVKMYFEAVDSGLLAAMGPQRWQTLCAISRHMNHESKAWPGQDLLAKHLGVSRQSANARVNDLLDFRFHGEPVITRETLPQGRGQKGRFSSNIYKIRPIAALNVFDQPPKSAEAPVDDSALESRATVSTKHDTAGGPENPDPSIPVSSSPDSASLDTNKNQTSNQKQETFNVQRDSESRPDSKNSHLEDERDSNSDRVHGIPRRTLNQDRDRSSAARSSSGFKTARDSSIAKALDSLRPRELSQGELNDLVHRIEVATRDRHSRARFRAIAQHVPKHLIEGLLADIHAAGHDLHTPGAYFEKRIQIECNALNIQLPSAKASKPSKSTVVAAPDSPSTSKRAA